MDMYKNEYIDEGIKTTLINFELKKARIEFITQNEGYLPWI